MSEIDLLVKVDVMSDLDGFIKNIDEYWTRSLKIQRLFKSSWYCGTVAGTASNTVSRLSTSPCISQPSLRHSPQYALLDPPCGCFPAARSYRPRSTIGPRHFHRPISHRWDRVLRRHGFSVVRAICASKGDPLLLWRQGHMVIADPSSCLYLPAPTHHLSKHANFYSLATPKQCLNTKDAGRAMAAGALT